MMNKIYFIILLSLLLFVFNQSINGQLINDTNVNNEELIECNEHNRNKLDETSTKITTFGDSERKYPSTKEQMNVWCR